MSEITDNQLVDRVRAGDRRAFGYLVERYRDTVFGLVRRMVRDSDDAKDVMQCVFVKVYENLGTFRPDLKFFSWLYRIAVNESLNFIESRRPCAKLGTDLVAPDASPEDAYQKSELARKIDAAMMELDASSRALIVLRHYAELSYQELAFVFDTRSRTIKSRLYEARRVLAHHLQKEGVSRKDTAMPPRCSDRQAWGGDWRIAPNTRDRGKLP